ncbi:MAG: hypothetical protein O7E52_02290 [Candidatus Poribacteria bacterium]|nr:hypothetical protein [Candidatus Poribacteria bacterium]
MTAKISDNVYAKLGARPIINAAGHATVMGGSTPSPVVQQAMEQASRYFVEMSDLLQKSGDHIAQILGVEAAYATSGCYAALVLSTAACITGNDPDKMARLPDTTGMKNEIVFQEKQRYGFDRGYTIPGSTLVTVGDADGCTPAQLEGAINENTAAIAYFVSPGRDSSVVSLDDAVKIAHAHDVPVIADAASQIHPLDYFRRTAQAADLVCFGAKYLGAPHSSGFVCGKKDLIDAVVGHGFISGRPFGRGMKLDRQEIIAVMTAVDAWFSMDHEARIEGYHEKFAVIERGLKGVPAVRETKVAGNSRYWVVDLHVVLDTGALGKNASQVVSELDAGNPRIRVSSAGDDTVAIRVDILQEGDEYIIADRLRSLLLS